MKIRRTIATTVFAAGLGVIALISPAAAQVSMNVTYFTVAESGDPDFNTNPCCSSYYTNEITGTLGPDGLPVYNPSYGGPTLYDVNSHGELTWWSPSQNSNVVQTGTGVVTLPFANYSFFPVNGTNSNGGDGNGFQAAIFRGVLDVPTAESVTFSFGADDDSFLALNNTIISQEGGIHGVSAAPVTTSVLLPGSYDLTLFYTDRHETGAGLYFNILTSGVTIAPGVPEPATWAMLLIGFGAIGWTLRSRRKDAVAAV